MDDRLEEVRFNLKEKQHSTFVEVLDADNNSIATGEFIAVRGVFKGGVDGEEFVEAATKDEAIKTIIRLVATAKMCLVPCPNCRHPCWRRCYHADKHRCPACDEDF